MPVEEYKLSFRDKVMKKHLEKLGIDYFLLFRYENTITELYQGEKRSGFRDESFTSSGCYIDYDALSSIIQYAKKSKLPGSEQEETIKPKAQTRKRLSADEVKELKKMYRQGYTKTSIAQKLGIAVSTVTYHVGKRKK